MSNDVMTACLALEAIENASGSNNKKQILIDSKSDAMLFLLDTALNPYHNYGVSEIDEHSDPLPVPPTLDALQELRHVLMKRVVTGNDARELLSQLTTCVDPIVNKWLKRVFSKNLRAGMATGIVNKVFTGLIPEFGIALCESLDESKPFPEGKWLVSTKIDGHRCITFVDANGNCNFVSRNNKPMYNLESIEDEIRALGFRSCVIDGEILANDFEGTTSVVKASKSDRSGDELSYLVFDFLTMQEWESKNTANLVDRLALLQSIVSGKQTNKLVILEHTEANSQAEVLVRFEKDVSLGYEGLVIKRPESKYAFDRCKDWLKWKPVDTFDVRIKDCVEGNGKFVGMLGYFVCDFNGVETHVGGGFKNEQRKEFWEKRNEMIDRVIEVEGAKILTPDGRIRFPVFLRMRDDKS